MNKIKEIEADQTQENGGRVTHRSVQRKRKASGKFLKVINIFGFIQKDMLVKIMPFVFFLTVIALVYIANSYYSEKTIREIDQATKDLKELRSEYISTKSDLMFKSNQSQVANAVLPVGLKESRTSPKKIVVENKKENYD